MKKGTCNPRRDIPATLVAAFIQGYIDANYELDPGTNDYGIGQFEFDSGIPRRRIYAILRGETTNVTFEVVDEMLVRLDEIHLWHLGPEDGGFADYYGDDPAPAAEQTIEQQRRNAVENAKRYARAKGGDWLEILMDRARAEMELACA